MQSTSQSSRLRERVDLPWGLFYLIGLTLAEALTVLYEPRIGLTLHGLLLLALLAHGASADDVRRRRFFFALSLAPLIRLLSMSLPLSGRPLVEWYLAIGVLLFAAVYFTFRVTELGSDRLGLNFKRWPLQVAFGLTGIGLGWVEYQILRPQPLVDEFAWQALWPAAFILFVFTGLLEEIVFRGLIQHTAIQRMGRRGLWFTAGLFAVLHLGYRSAADVAFVFVVGLLFGYVVHKTGSLLGVSLSHGLTNITLYLVFPFLLAPSPLDLGALTTVPITPAASTASPTPTVTITPSMTLEPTAAEGAATTPTPGPAATPVVVDDGEVGFERSDGQWWQEPRGVDGDLHWAFAVSGEPTTVIEWHPTLEACGRYRVEAYLPPDFPTTRQAAYTIIGREGSMSVTVDQRGRSGAWVDLGGHWFEPDAESLVRLSNNTGEGGADPPLLVVFDAVRWTLLEPCRGTPQAASPPP